MIYPFSASIILVKMSEDSPVSAQVLYGSRSEGGTRVELTMDLGVLPDATDQDMLMQMITATLCDKL